MPQELTKEQAVVLAGFTGITTCNFGLLHEDIEKRLGRPVWTHEFANSVFAEQIKEMYREDFLAMCYKGE